MTRHTPMGRPQRVVRSKGKDMTHVMTSSGLCSEMNAAYGHPNTQAPMGGKYLIINLPNNVPIMTDHSP